MILLMSVSYADDCNYLRHFVCIDVFVCQRVGVYFPVDVGHVETYGSLSVKLKSVDLASHSDIVIRDFVLSVNNRQVSNEIFH